MRERTLPTYIGENCCPAVERPDSYRYPRLQFDRNEI